MTEQEFIIGCKKKDSRCQEQLYYQYYPDMIKLCLRYSKTQEEAVEMMNEGFLKIFSKIDSFKFEGPLGAWIRKIMINTAIDYYRKKNKISIAPPLSIEETKDISIQPAIYSKISSDEIMSLVTSLPQPAGIIFNLFAVDGFSHAEIATFFNIPESTSRWHLAQARKLLKEQIEYCFQLKKDNYEGICTYR